VPGGGGRDSSRGEAKNSRRVRIRTTHPAAYFLHLWVSYCCSLSIYVLQ